MNVPTEGHVAQWYLEVRVQVPLSVDLAGVRGSPSEKNMNLPDASMANYELVPLH